MNDTCPFSLSLYPSKAMEDDYKSRDPGVFTIIVVLIFALTSVAFLMYDHLVERRQKKVLSSAIQSSAIVSSLFPSTVRDRLFQSDDATDSRNASPSNSLPIADRYKCATVMFADM
jgi:hypothetical protein